MADISQALDQIRQGSTQTTTDISSSVDALRQGTSQTSTQATSQGGAKIKPEVKSPLSNIERMRLSFADDAGREEFLRNRFSIVQRLENGKFAVGNDPNQVTPIDPEGVFNDVMGDLADVVSEIPVVAGQILGAVSGIFGTGGAASIPAAGVGAAGGEFIRQKIGKALGVRQSKAMEDATDLAIVGAFGAAGQSLIPASKFVGTAIKSKLLSRLGKKATQESITKGIPVEGTLSARTTAKTFKALANVPEESTLTVFRHGIEETLGNPKNLSKNTVVRLADNLKKTLTVARKKAGEKVGKATDKLIEKNQQKVDISDAYKNLRSNFQELNLLDDSGNIIRTNTSKDNLTFARRMLSRAAGSNKVLSSFPEDLVIPKQGVKSLIKMRRELGDSIDSTLTPRMKKVIAEFVDGKQDGSVAGIRSLVDDIAKNSGSTDYIRANKNFSELSTLLDDLNFIKKDDVVSLERFIKGQENLPLTQVRSLRALEDSLPKNQKFLKEIEQWNAAQDFTKANPNILRFSVIAGALGLTTGFEGPAEKAITIGGALTLGTPAGLRMLLRAGNRGRQAVKSIPRTVKGAERIATKKQQQQVLNALISAGARGTLGSR